ncbi:hypothetical protein BCR44DRAFT_1281392 [Catenaria anguillulae PL171]|uniref:Kinesin-like protein KIF6/9 C-terminal domain-containing protein n=1 Tax=Catenaria anguillulae PL171 TaxID=765915 RepID=A0A1Y2HYE7_9FUNG|nr:hypothetical protein BCR44DRAFT_1281392 [Catenaria anguillulae PL171]
MYKKGAGKELATALVDNKSVLRDKKKKYNDLMTRQTDLKSRIDTLKHSIAQDRDRALQSDTAHDPQLVTIPLSDETRAKIEQVRSLKAELKATTDQVQGVRSELEYAARVVDTCRERLVREFDAWFDNVFGGPDVAVAASVSVASVGRKVGSAGVAGGMPIVPMVDLDTLDPAEHMDYLQQQRIKGEDPASFAYYAALRKNARKVKGGGNAGVVASRGVGVRV